MASVWKRLQRVNKRAAKFQFTASYHRVDLETTAKWKPNKLSVVWSRRSRRVISEPLDWEPSMKEPLKGSVIWAVPDNHTIAVTLFRDQRTNELEDKDWVFILEDVSTSGRRRRVAQAALNLRPLASAGSIQRELSLTLRPATTKVTAASMEVTISSVLLKEGSAADEDMQSMASMMSVNNNCDIAPLDDFDDDCSLSDTSASMQQMLDLTQQMELMTCSLAGTPGSIASLASTPTVPMVPIPCIREPVDYSNEPPQQQQPPLAFTPSARHLHKKDLKPLDLKTNLNDFPYSQDTESHSNVETPIIENIGMFDRNLISSNQELKSDSSRGKLTREDSGEGKDLAPAQDLLQWCKEVTQEYRQCNITNLTSSWADGIAFCAIIHHFRPDLIDMSSLTPGDADTCVREALRASEVLGIPCVFHVSEVRRGPDRLALLTYLHQLRALFTHSQLRLHKIGPTAEESSYTIGRFNTDKETDISVELFSQEILSMRQKRMEGQPNPNRTSLSSQDSVDSQHSQERQTSPGAQEAIKDRSPAARDMRNMLMASKNILGKVLSPTKDKLSSLRNSLEKFSHKELPPEPSKPVPVISPPKEEVSTFGVRPAYPVTLMTRKQLTDPFGSDEEDDVIQVQLSIAKTAQPTVELREKTPDIQNDVKVNAIEKDRDSRSLSPIECLPKPTQQLLSRHDELKERARQLLEAARKEARERDNRSVLSSKETTTKTGTKEQNGGSPLKQAEDARQAQLREQARKLIAQARAGMVQSPTSPGRVEVLTTAHVLAEQAASIPRAGSLDNSPARSDSRGGSDSENNILNNREDPLENNGNSAPARRPDPPPRTSPLQSFANLLERISPDKNSYITRGFGADMSAYIERELEALEREQAAIDRQAAELEGELRTVMDSGQAEKENALMSMWFTLVNKKNALLRRQMQLNILEQESELRERHARVDGELRALLGVEEWRKSEGQRGREARLLSELLSVVDARDQLVHHLHEHEQALEDDDEIERNLSNVELHRKNNCSIQ